MCLYGLHKKEIHDLGKLSAIKMYTTSLLTVEYYRRKRSQKYLMEQLFPLMLHKNAKDRFNFEDCRFTMTRAKEATGRIVFWNMGITNSFTLEASYGGSNKGHKSPSPGMAPARGHTVAASGRIPLRFHAHYIRSQWPLRIAARPP